MVYGADCEQRLQTQRSQPANLNSQAPNSDFSNPSRKPESWRVLNNIIGVEHNLDSLDSSSRARSRQLPAAGQLELWRLLRVPGPVLSSLRSFQLYLRAKNTEGKLNLTLESVSSTRVGAIGSERMHACMHACMHTYYVHMSMLT